MPQDGSDGSGDSALSRRKMLALTSGAAAGGLAGCGGDGGGDEPSSPSPRVETQIVTKEGSDETVVKTVKVTEEATATPEPELMEPTMDVLMGRLPTEVSLNGFHPDGSATLSARLNSRTANRFFNGDIENIAWKSREWDPDNKVWTLKFKEDYIHWWNGEPYTAEDWYVGQATNHILFGDGSYWGEKPELVDEYTVKCFPPIARDEILMAARYAQPIRQPASEWSQFLNAVEEATTQEEIDKIYSEDVQKYERGLDTVVENGWASGPYYPTDYDEQKIVMTRRDLVDGIPDHPHNEKQNIPTWKLNVVGGQAASDQMISNDRIDMGGGPLAPRFRDITPRYIQTLDVVPKPFGHNLQFNFKNKHLSNVWVRRAVVAAINKNDIIKNAGGGNKKLVSSDSGMPAALDKKYLGDEFTSQLYDYPDKTDMEMVNKWMKKAGYEKNSNGKWEDGDGEVPELRIKGPGGWAARQQTILSQLQDAGFEGNLQSFGWGTFEEHVRVNYDYELATFQWGCWGQIPHPWCYYRGDKHLNMNYGYKPAELENKFISQGKTKSDLNNKPIVANVPDEVGALEISGSGTEVNMLDVGRALEGGKDVEKNAKLGARFVNYYVDHLPLWSSTDGAWGDTKNFSWPARGNKKFQTGAAQRVMFKQGDVQGNYKS